MKITKLEPSQHRNGRWLVFLEDGALLRVGEGDVVRLGLYAGLELSEEAARELNDTAEGNHLREKALAYLAARPLSKKELLDKLTASRPRRRGRPERPEPEPDPEEQAREQEKLRRLAQAEADRLEELGLLDDAAYARTVVEHYAAKGYGERRIRDELYRRGVPRAYWDEALTALRETESGQETSRVDELLQKKLRGAEPTRENLKRASDYLARRGFGWQEISEAIERYKEL